MDHTGLTDGRFLAIDVSTLAGPNGILWARRNLEVLPNQDINLEFFAYNLMQTSGNGNNPEVLVELLDASGNILQSFPTAEIPKNTNTSDWHNRQLTLNPGTNTVVDIVLRSNLDSDFGNDLILDDIRASQQPELCDKSTDLTVVVAPGAAFAANLLGTNAPSCAGGADGSIRFEVDNFDATTGFEYSIDGGTTWVARTVSPVTTAANLGSGSYNILIRKISDNSCTATLTTTLNDPTPIIPTLNETVAFDCFNSGATLEASATGGNPAYQYQLEDPLGTVIRPYQNTTSFANVRWGLTWYAS